MSTNLYILYNYSREITIAFLENFSDAEFLIDCFRLFEDNHDEFLIYKYPTGNY